jgi:hypothetical protein
MVVCLVVLSAFDSVVSTEKKLVAEMEIQLAVKKVAWMVSMLVAKMVGKTAICSVVH